MQLLDCAPFSLADFRCWDCSQAWYAFDRPAPEVPVFDEESEVEDGDACPSRSLVASLLICNILAFLLNVSGMVVSKFLTH